MVVKKNSKGQWCTYHCHGKDAGKVIACFPTREAAMVQHRAIEASKHIKKGEIEMNNNIIESIEWHREQLGKLMTESEFDTLKFELDTTLEKMKSKKSVLVHRGGKTFYREQEVGSKDDKVGSVPKGNKRLTEKNDYGISMNDVKIGDYVDCGQYGKGPVTEKPSDSYITVGGEHGGHIHISDVKSTKKPKED